MLASPNPEQSPARESTKAEDQDILVGSGDKPTIDMSQLGAVIPL